MDPLFVPKPSNRVRVILNTDAKNEADDQYAIVHAILTPLFELHGIIPAHFGDRRGPGSLQASHEEVMKLLDLMDLNGRIPVHSGAATMLPNEVPHRLKRSMPSCCAAPAMVAPSSA